MTRNPYVGEGADGARRSAAIDRSEADGLDRDDPRRDELLASADAWDAQADALDERFSLTVAATAAGITYRQVDYWVGRGYIHVHRTRPGSGMRRTAPIVEIRILRLMARMVHAGIIPEVAARAAREMVEGNRPLAPLGEQLTIIDTTPEEQP